MADWYTQTREVWVRVSSGSTKKLMEYALCHVDATGQRMNIERFR